MVGRALGVGVVLCDDFHLRNTGVMFTFHERQEQEYYLHRARGLGLADHPPAHLRNSFQLTEPDVGGCRVVLKTVYWILLYIIDTEQARVVGRLHKRK